jgi:hypothetical protein
MYSDITAFTSEICALGFPLLERLTNGPAHNIANLTKSIFQLIANVDSMTFVKDHKNFEIARGRTYDKLPPWQASKSQLRSVRQLLCDLKVPKGYPPLFDSIESITTLKLEQTLSLAGDVGRYLLDALGINSVIAVPMQAYLRALQDCQQKTPVIPIADIMSRFRESAAALEALLPAYWSSITKHYGTHLDRFQELWGCFWSCNELIHERILGKMKRLSRHGSKNRIKTLAKNWDVFQAANNWLLDDQLVISYRVNSHLVCYTFLPYLHASIATYTFLPDLYASFAIYSYNIPT